MQEKTKKSGSQKTVIRQRVGQLPKPLTVVQLEAINPGQSIVYYRGNFALDIQRAIEQKECPSYVELLQVISAKAESLKNAGRVDLLERVINAAQRVIEYIAIGKI